MSLRIKRNFLEVKIDFKGLVNELGMRSKDVSELLGFALPRQVDDMKYRGMRCKIPLELYIRMISVFDINTVLRNTIITDIQSQDETTGQEYLLKILSNTNSENFIRSISNEVRDKKIKELQSKIDLIKGIVGLEL